MESYSSMEQQRNPTLEDAWQRFAEYDHNANLTSDRFSVLRKWILILGVLATTLAITHALYLKSTEQELLMSLEKVSHWLVLLLPITVSVLLTGINKFERGVNWIILRGSSEALKNEIYRFRTRTGGYSEMQVAESTREMVLAKKVRSIGERLMKTEVNQSGLQEYKGVLPPLYGAADGDDGFTALSPDAYVKFRLTNQLNYYKRKSAELDSKIRRLNWQIILLGGLGTFLAAMGFEAWIAVTTAMVGAITSFIGYTQFENSLRTFNQAATDLESIRIWWRALTEEQRDTQEMYDRLVESAESVLQTEQSSWAQNLQDALAELLETDQQKLASTGIPELPAQPHLPDDTYIYEGNYPPDDDPYQLTPEEVAAMAEMEYSPDSVGDTVKSLDLSPSEDLYYDNEEVVSGSMGEVSSNTLAETASDMLAEVKAEGGIDEDVTNSPLINEDSVVGEDFDPDVPTIITEDVSNELAAQLTNDVLASAGLEVIEIEDNGVSSDEEDLDLFSEFSED